MDSPSCNGRGGSHMCKGEGQAVGQLVEHPLPGARTGLSGLSIQLCEELSNITISEE